MTRGSRSAWHFALFDGTHSWYLSTKQYNLCIFIYLFWRYFIYDGSTRKAVCQSFHTEMERRQELWRVFFFLASVTLHV